MNVYFTDDEFRASESELSLSVMVGKSKRIATPLMLTLRSFEVPDLVSTFSVDTANQASSPDGCSCECHLSPELYSKKNNTHAIT